MQFQALGILPSLHDSYLPSAPAGAVRIAAAAVAAAGKAQTHGYALKTRPENRRRDAVPFEHSHSDQRRHHRSINFTKESSRLLENRMERADDLSIWELGKTKKISVHVFAMAHIILLFGNKDEAVVVDHVAVNVLRRDTRNQKYKCQWRKTMLSITNRAYKIK